MEKTPEWTVIYHQPGVFKGRGEFLRLMLEDKGVEYVNSAEDLYGPNGCMDCFRGSPEAIDADASKDKPKYPYPTFFPPAIWHRPPPGDGGEEVFVNQVGACMIFLGEKLGYAPTTPAERARADQVLLNALDYISEGRSSFHPVKNSASYKDQKEEGDRISKEFSQGRMKHYLHHFNKIVHRNLSPKCPIAGGNSVTYADFALFHVLDATVSQFNTDFYGHAWDGTTVPALKEYYVWMKSRSNLQSYFKTDRCARTYNTVMTNFCSRLLIACCFHFCAQHFLYLQFYHPSNPSRLSSIRRR